MKLIQPIALLGGLSFLLTASVSHAQGASPDLWQKIAARDQRLQKFSAQWQMTETQLPNPKGHSPFGNAPAPDNLPSGALEQLSPDQKKQVAQQKSEILAAEKEWETGFSVRQSINAVRVGEKTRTELRSSTPNHEAHVIEYYDGKLYASLEEVQLAPFSVRKDKKSEWMARVVPRPAELFDITMPDEVSLLLAQQPITTFFNRDNTEIIDRGDKIVLRRKTPIDKFKDAFVEVTLTKKELAPVEFAQYPSTGAKAATLFKTEMQTIDGKLLPKKVYSAEASQSSTVVYDLKQASINEEVDKNAVLLPAGVVVSDYRFGQDNGVNYPINDGNLLSDEQVKKLLGEKPSPAPAPLQKAVANPQHPPLMILAGFGLIGVGGMLWKKSSSEK